MAKRITPKQFVQNSLPHATAIRWRHGWAVFNEGRILAFDPDWWAEEPRRAWRVAMHYVGAQDRAK